jgi:hypothetical protein
MKLRARQYMLEAYCIYWVTEEVAELVDMSRASRAFRYGAVMLRASRK